MIQANLRASHRELHACKDPLPGLCTLYDHGVVINPVRWHDHDHLEPPQPGTTYDYEIELWPTAKQMPAGHRLRIALYSADTANHLTLLKPVINTVHAGSCLLLPIQTGAS